MDAAFSRALRLFEQSEATWASGRRREAIRQCRTAIAALECCGRLRSPDGAKILCVLASWLEEATDPKAAIEAADHACAILHQLGPRYASSEAKRLRMHAWLLLGRLLRDHTADYNRASRFLGQASDACLDEYDYVCNPLAGGASNGQGGEHAGTAGANARFDHYPITVH